jgi:hypothetical protein
MHFRASAYYSMQPQTSTRLGSSGKVGATLQTAGALTPSGSTSRWGRSGVQPTFRASSKRMWISWLDLVAETVDQRGSPSSASAPWTGGGKKQLAAIEGGNGAYELTEVELPGSSSNAYSNAASRKHRAVRVPPHRTQAPWQTTAGPMAKSRLARVLDHREGDGAKKTSGR